MHTHYTLHIQSPASRPLVAGAQRTVRRRGRGQVPGRATISWSSQCVTQHLLSRSVTNTSWSEHHKHLWSVQCCTECCWKTWHISTHFARALRSLRLWLLSTLLHTRWFNPSEGSVLCLLSQQWDAKENYSDCWNSGNLIMTTLSYVSRQYAIDMTCLWKSHFVNEFFITMIMLLTMQWQLGIHCI